MLKPVFLLFVSNIFMTYAWYGHLRDLKNKPLWVAIGISWAVALLEYCFQVPANRFGHGVYTLPQLKVIQEIITMIVFSIFAMVYMDTRITMNFVYAAVCLVMAAYFIFRDSGILG